MFKNLKIGSKIIVLVSTIIILLTSSIAGVTLLETKKAMQIQVATSLENTLDQQKERIIKYFTDAEMKIRAISELDIIKSVSRGDSYSEKELRDNIKLLNKGSSFSFSLYNKKGEVLFSDKRLSDFPKKDQSILSTLTGKKRKYGQISEENGQLSVNLYRGVGAVDKEFCIISFKLNLTPILDLLESRKGIGETGEYLIAQNTSKGLRFVNSLRKDSTTKYLKRIPNDPNTAIPMRKAVAGKTGSGIGSDYIGDEVISAWSPLKSELSLGIVAKQDSEEAFESIDNLTFLVSSVSIISVLIAFAVILVFAKTISTPLIQLQNVFKELSVGKLFDKMIKTKRRDEIGSMIHSVNDLVSYQGKIVSYAQRVGNGDFSVAKEIKNDSGDLSKALLNMTVSLKDASEKEELRNWSIKGLAQFSDILRGNNDDMLALGFSIISNLVNYLGVNQGGLFVIGEKEDGTPVLSLNGYYAYNREKFMEKEVIPGEGLVGQCFLEQEKIHLTEVPQEYVSVTSGLGDATPESLLLIPLKVNDEVYGVIELASFNSFEEYQIEFVEKLGESIASTISSVKVAQKTKKLLDESTGMSNALQSQEEQLRQTMEEMQATQEEMSQNESYLQSHKSALSNSNMICEIGLDSNIQSVNSLLLESTGFSSDDLIGKNINLLKHSSVKSADFASLLEAMKGTSKNGQIMINTKHGKSINSLVTFSPITNNDQVIGLIGIFKDISSISVETDSSEKTSVTPMPNDQSEELTKAKEKITKLREKVRELKTNSKQDNSDELKLLQSENSKLKKDLQELEENANNTSDSSQLTELQSQLEQSTNLIQGLHNEKLELESKLAELDNATQSNSNSNDQSDKINELNYQLQQATELLNNLNSENEANTKALNAEIEALKTSNDADENKTKIKELELQNEELISQLNSISSESNPENSDIQALSEKYQALELELSQASSELNSTSEKLKISEDKNQRLDNLLSDAQANLKLLSNEKEKNVDPTSSLVDDLLDKSIMNVTLNSNLQINDVNKSLLENLKVEKDVLMNKPFIDLVMEYEGNDLTNDLEENLKNTGRFITDLLIEINDSKKWYETTFTGYIKDDQVIEVLVMLVDISE